MLNKFKNFVVNIINQAESPVPISGTLVQIFVTFPLIMLLFFIGARRFVSYEYFEVINTMAVILEVLAILIVLISKMRSNFFTGLITYIMGVLMYVSAPLAVVGVGGGENYLSFQLITVLIYPIIIFIVLAIFTNTDRKQKTKYILLYTIFGIPAIIATISTILLITMGDIWASWLCFGLELIFSPILFLGLGNVFYPLKHRSNYENLQKVSRLEVPSEFIKNQKFDKNKFKKK